MAAVATEESLSRLPTAAGATQSHGGTEDTKLQGLMISLGMDPNPINDLQKPDFEWLQVRFV